MTTKWILESPSRGPPVLWRSNGTRTSAGGWEGWYLPTPGISIGGREGKRAGGDLGGDRGWAPAPDLRGRTCRRDWVEGGQAEGARIRQSPPCGRGPMTGSPPEPKVKQSQQRTGRASHKTTSSGQPQKSQIPKMGGKAKHSGHTLLLHSEPWTEGTMALQQPGQEEVPRRLRGTMGQLLTTPPPRGKMVTPSPQLSGRLHTEA